MATVKKYLDYAGLGSYDTQLKAWANGANQLGYKSFVVNEGKLYLFTKQDAAVSDIVASGDNATPYVDISGSDISSTLDALAAVIGATYSNGAYSMTLTGFGNDVDTAVEALNELRSELTTATNNITTLNGSDSTSGSVAKAIKDAIEALDVSEFALASKDASTNVVTIKGIKEVDGVIAVGTDTTKDVTLAAVAATGAAEDVSYTATIGGTSVTDVDSALDALATLAGSGAASKTIYMASGTPGADYAAVYNIYQGSEGDASTPDANELVGTINIPKDQFVDEASLVDITFDSTNVKLMDGATDVTSLITSGTPTAADAGKYVKLVFEVTTGNAAKSTIYISVKSLVDVYTGGDTSEISVSVDASTNVITATVVKVAGTKVVYKAAYTDNTDPQNPVNVPEETVVDALNNIGSIPLTGTDSIASLFA